MSLNQFGKVTYVPYTRKFPPDMKIFYAGKKIPPSHTDFVSLKVDDIDGHIKHLEKFLIPVIEENQLLQRRLEALEKMILPLIEENKCMHKKLNALELLYELD